MKMSYRFHFSRKNIISIQKKQGQFELSLMKQWRPLEIEL